jgi:hypothetical protein
MRKNGPAVVTTFIDRVCAKTVVEVVSSMAARSPEAVNFIVFIEVVCKYIVLVL